MKTFVIVMVIITGLLLASTLICGFWMRAQEQVDPSSISFHMGIALLAVLSTVITLALALSQMGQSAPVS
jgi:hypothetical protein